MSWIDCYREALAGWGLENAQVKQLSLSENATFLVEDATLDAPRILRLHRPGYRTLPWIESELAWEHELACEGRVRVADIYPTLEGKHVHTFVNSEGVPENAVLFEYLSGHEPLEEGLSHMTRAIGRVAAALHGSAASWELPSWFDRPVWDAERILGADSDYGNWRDTPEVTPKLAELLEKVELVVRRELAVYGRTARNCGLIHTDLRSSNLLVDSDGELKVIDFDDCGIGWYLFDVACTFSFEESDDDLEDMLYSYVRGYKAGHGVLDDIDFTFLPTMLMARRLMLVAWVEARRETRWAQQVRESYVADTARIAKLYLEGRYIPHIVADAATSAHRVPSTRFGVAA